MEWLNLHTSILDSAEVIGADPTERGTWLMLLRYCIGQENGGIIQNCREWKDRKWQQLIRITKAEAMRSCDLYTWHGDDLHVTHYPTGKEQEIKRLREIGRISTPAKKASAKANGSLGGRPPKNPIETQQETEQSPEQETHTKPIERKGREEERNIKEAEEEAAAAASDLDKTSDKQITPEMLRDAYPRKTHLADTLREAAACMRRHDPQKILDGTRAIAAAVARWTESERMTYLKKPSEFFAGDHWADDPAHWRGRHDRTTTPTQEELPSLGGRKPASHILI